MTSYNICCILQTCKHWISRIRKTSNKEKYKAMTEENRIFEAKIELISRPGFLPLLGTFMKKE